MLSNNTNKSNQHITITISITRVRIYGGRCVKDGCGTGTISRILKIAMDRFQCTWVTIIGELYKLIVKYLGNGSNKDLLTI